MELYLGIIPLQMPQSFWVDKGNILHIGRINP
jgi:hypothetical protein